MGSLAFLLSVVGGIVLIILAVLFCIGLLFVLLACILKAVTKKKGFLFLLLPGILLMLPFAGVGAFAGTSRILSVRERRIEMGPFMTAVDKGRVGKACRMIQDGEDVNQLGDYDNPVTPLILASGNNDLRMVTMLLDEGADPNLCIGSGNPLHRSTALFEASALGHLEVVEILVESGADIDRFYQETDVYTGLTALMYMVRFGNSPEVLNYLAAHSEDIDQQGYLGETALMIAVDPLQRHRGNPLTNDEYNRRYEFAEVLLKNGADPNIAADNGMTVLAILSDHYRYTTKPNPVEGDIMDLLKEYGAVSKR